MKIARLVLLALLVRVSAFATPDDYAIQLKLQADFTVCSALDSTSEPLPGKIHARIDGVMRGERPETGAPVLVEFDMETSQERTDVSLSPEQPARASAGR